MDEVFWSNVVKRWSDAAENVIVLRKELAKVQEERALYRSLLDTYRRSDVRPSDLRHIERVEFDPVPQNVNVDANVHVELMQDAEAGLGRAKEEYRRLQQELATSTEQIKVLKQENERMLSEHKEETAHLKDEIQKLVAANTSLRKSLEQVSNPQSKAVTEHGSDGSKKSSVANRDFERQIETLKRSVKDCEAENQDLRDELIITQDRLHRAEDNSKALLESIKKLQGITRHSTILRPLSNVSLYSEARKSSGQLSVNSPTQTLDLDKDMISKIKTSKHVDDTSLNHESSVVGDERTARNFLVLPQERQNMLAALPSAPVAIIDALSNHFERSFLKKALGEDVQSLCKFLPENQIDRKAITSSYLCPTLNHHPWCPPVPGQHGFLFVGLGKEKDSYRTPVVRNLFVGLPKGQSKTRTFRYLGKYRVTRVKPLSVEEWNSLSAEGKYMYAKLTGDKTRDVRPPEDILLAYDKGTLAVPCVQLQFLSFDDHIYSALLALNRDIQEH